MRPEIAVLTSKAFYPSLLNHRSVETFPRIEGMASNIYFVTHCEQEKISGENNSKANAYEADFLLLLCLYLVQQGYEPKDIVLLTTYLGQERLLSKVSQRFLHFALEKATIPFISDALQLPSSNQRRRSCGGQLSGRRAPHRPPVPRAQRRRHHRLPHRSQSRLRGPLQGQGGSLHRRQHGRAGCKIGNLGKSECHPQTARQCRASANTAVQQAQLLYQDCERTS